MALSVYDFLGRTNPDLCGQLGEKFMKVLFDHQDASRADAISALIYTMGILLRDLDASQRENAIEIISALLLSAINHARNVAGPVQ